MFPFAGWRYINEAYYSWLKESYAGACDKAKNLLKRVEKVPELRQLSKELQKGAVPKPLLLDR